MAKPYAEKEYVQLPEELHYITEHNTATKFNRVWGGHRFTDEEVLALKRGETIEITGRRQDGSSFTAKGALAGQTFSKDDGSVIAFVGFKPVVDPSVYIVGQWTGRPGRETKFRRAYRRDGGHTFTDAEGAELLAGKTITFTSDEGKKVTGALAELVFDAPDGRRVPYVGFEAEVSPDYAVGEWTGRPGRQTKFKRVFSGYEFTDEDVADLLAGRAIGFVGTKRDGGTWEVTGRLAEKTFEKDGQQIRYVGFEPIRDEA